MKFAKKMKISELAKTVGVNTQTVRYYEREGLLAKPQRNASGYRIYNTGAVDRLRFICEAKEIGFTLREIRQIIGLDIEKPQSCGCVQSIVADKIKSLEDKIKAMRRMKKRLQLLHDSCSENSSDAPCPALEILNG